MEDVVFLLKSSRLSARSATFSPILPVADCCPQDVTASRSEISGFYLYDEVIPGLHREQPNKYRSILSTARIMVSDSPSFYENRPVVFPSPDRGRGTQAPLPREEP